ncbi:MAG: YihY/virulence factor BrkB family protein [Alicyclobacillus sp.]|nr:YihY/virulence factor BrkB family protein [Alicyclobacillus sp.]
MWTDERNTHGHRGPTSTRTSWRADTWQPAIQLDDAAQGDAAHAPLWRRIWDRTFEIIQAMGRHNLAPLAGAIAFFGFSSLLPVLALLVFITSLAFPEVVIEHFIEGIFRSYVPAIPTGGMFAVQTVQRLMTLREVTSIIGLCSLVWSTIGGFMTLQGALDIIYEVHQRRNFILQYVIAFAMMGILLALTLAAAMIATVSPAFVAVLAQQHAAAGLVAVHWAGRVAFPVILFCICFFVYRVLPSRPLHTWPLLAETALATIFIYLTRAAFGIYTHHLGNYQLMYGTLTFVMLFTFWLYIICMILLVVAEVAAALDRWVYEGGTS